MMRLSGGRGEVVMGNNCGRQERWRLFIFIIITVMIINKESPGPGSNPR